MSKLINKQNLSFELELNKIPISSNLKLYLSRYNKRKNQYIFNGDDYQVLFTAPLKKRPLIESIANKINLKVTIIGKIISGYKKNSLKLDNKSENVTNFKGYSHKFW